MSGNWGREDEPDLAIERILAAADKAFVDLGVSAAGMSEIADYAGCSRGTLYRYFKNRHQLHLAYVEQRSRVIHSSCLEEVSSIADPREKLVEYILGAIRAVRQDAATAAWFASGNQGLVARMSRSAEVVAALTDAWGSDPTAMQVDDSSAGLRQRWLVRVIVSLLTDPGESEEEERLLVERFVIPAFV